MTLPIKGSDEIEIKTDGQEESLVDNLNTDEQKKLFNALNKKMGTQQENTEKKEFNHTHFEHLLNKPNMTPKDKSNMEKSIKFLIDHKMDTSENLKKLEAINYGSNYIEIGGIKRARENLKAEPNNKNIFKHDDEVYFKFDALKEQNKLLAKQGMEIPTKDDFYKAFNALPRKYADSGGYIGGNILGIILDVPMSGGCDSYGRLEYYKIGFGGLFTSGGLDIDDACYICPDYIGFDKNRGSNYSDPYFSAYPVRPILK